MNRSIRDGCQRATIAFLMASTSIAEGQNDAEADLLKLDDWYRTEIIVFARDDQQALASEQWDPLPSLNYPDQYRFLIDPALANRRAQESQSFSSKIDDSGIQHLVVPALERLLETLDRPDSLLPEPILEEDSDTGSAPQPSDTIGPNPAELAQTLSDTSPLAVTGFDESGDPLAVEAPEPIPFLKLGPEQHRLTNQAAALRRRGQRVLFHEAWWAPLDEQDKTLPIVLERSGDSDAMEWPALQGSVTVYKSRYLHAVVDVWLNTDATYLPAGWQIDAPPKAPNSVLAATLAGEPLDPWGEPEPEMFVNPILSQNTREPDQSDWDSTGIPIASNASSAAYATETSRGIEQVTKPAREPEPEEGSLLYPWHHAIVHRQSRRMRGGELHYLDHPVIGVLVWVQAVSEELSPNEDAGDLAFRKLHGLLNLKNAENVNDEES